MGKLKMHVILRIAHEVQHHFMVPCIRHVVVDEGPRNLHRVKIRAGSVPRTDTDPVPEKMDAFTGGD